MAFGDIRTTLSLDNKQFRRELDKSANQAKSFQGKVQGGFKRLDGGVGQLTGSIGALRSSFIALGAVATLQGVKSLNQFTKQTFALLDSLGKTSRLLGLTTTELQEYEFAAERSGVAVRTLRLGFQRFSRRVGEARAGTGELKNTLKELNISLYDAEGRSKTNRELFDELGEALSKTTNKTDQLRHGFKAFDRDGVKLIQMFENGRAGLEAYREEAERLNLIVGEELIENSEEFQDKQAELNRLNKKVSADFANAWAPISLVFDELTLKAKGFFTALLTGGVEAPLSAEAIKTRLSEIGEQLGSGVGGHRGRNLRAERERLIKQLQDRVTKDLEKQQKSTEEAQAQADADRQSRLKKQNEEYEKALKEAMDIAEMGEEKVYQARLRNAKNKVDLIEDEKERTQAKIDLEIIEEGVKVQKLLDNEELLDSHKREIDEAYNEFVKNKRQELSNAIMEIERVEAEERKKIRQKQLEEQSKIEREVLETNRKAIEAYNKEQQQLYDRDPITQFTKHWEDSAERMRYATASWLEDAGNRLTEFIMTGKADFGDFVKSILAGLVKIQITKALAGIGSSLFGAGIPAPTPVPAANPALLPTLSGYRQHGGMVAPHKTYKVGEAGAEYLTMGSKGGYITPNSGMSNISINVKNEGQPKNATLTGKQVSGRDMVLSVMLEDARNNGSYLQTLKARGLKS